MKLIGVFLVVFGIVGILMSSAMVGDIGIAGMIGSIVGILSGAGFIKLSKLPAIVAPTQQGKAQ